MSTSSRRENSQARSTVTGGKTRQDRLEEQSMRAYKRIDSKNKGLDLRNNCIKRNFDIAKRDMITAYKHKSHQILARSGQDNCTILVMQEKIHKNAIDDLQSVMDETPSLASEDATSVSSSTTKRSNTIELSANSSDMFDGIFTVAGENYKTYMSDIQKVRDVREKKTKHMMTVADMGIDDERQRRLILKKLSYERKRTMEDFEDLVNSDWVTTKPEDFETDKEYVHPRKRAALAPQEETMISETATEAGGFDWIKPEHLLLAANNRTVLDEKYMNKNKLQALRHPNPTKSEQNDAIKAALRKSYRSITRTDRETLEEKGKEDLSKLTDKEIAAKMVKEYTKTIKTHYDKLKMLSANGMNKENKLALMEVASKINQLLEKRKKYTQEFNVVVEQDPEDYLNCSYLRLTKTNIENLLDQLRAQGVELDVHPHMTKEEMLAMYQEKKAARKLFSLKDAVLELHARKLKKVALDSIEDAAEHQGNTKVPNVARLLVLQKKQQIERTRGRDRERKARQAENLYKQTFGKPTGVEQPPQSS